MTSPCLRGQENTYSTKCELRPWFQPCENSYKLALTSRQLFVCCLLLLLSLLLFFSCSVVGGLRVFDFQAQMSPIEPWVRLSDWWLGGFLNYPQIIHFNGIFPYKTSSYWGTPISGNLHLVDITSHCLVLEYGDNRQASWVPGVTKMGREWTPFWSTWIWGSVARRSHIQLMSTPSLKRRSPVGFWSVFAATGCWKPYRFESENRWSPRVPTELSRKIGLLFDSSVLISGRKNKIVHFDACSNLTWFFGGQSFWVTTMSKM